jgi:hypothetical protein
VRCIPRDTLRPVCSIYKIWDQYRRNELWLSWGWTLVSGWKCGHHTIQAGNIPEIKHCICQRTSQTQHPSYILFLGTSTGEHLRHASLISSYNTECCGVCTAETAEGNYVMMRFWLCTVPLRSISYLFEFLFHLYIYYSLQYPWSKRKSSSQASFWMKTGYRISFSPNLFIVTQAVPGDQ